MSLDVRTSLKGGPHTYALWWSLDVLGLIIVIWRMYTRVFVRKVCGWDDYLICLAALFIVASDVCFTMLMMNGLEKHLIFLTPREIIEASQWFKAVEVVTIIPPALIKTSASISILRLVSVTQSAIRVIILVNVVVLALSAAITVGVSASECLPSISNGGHLASKHCLSLHTIKAVYEAYGIVGTITDFLCAGIPTLIIHRLQMDRSTKTALCLLLGLALFPGICSIMKTIDTSEVDAPDIFWALQGEAFWIALEIHAGIIIASCPMVYASALVLCQKSVNGITSWTQALVVVGSHPFSRTDRSLKTTQMAQRTMQPLPSADVSEASRRHPPHGAV